MSAALQPVFDGHNDTLLKLWRHDPSGASFFGGSRGHIDLPRIRQGGFVGGLFATFVPDMQRAQGATPEAVSTLAAVSQERALSVTLAQMGLALRIAGASEGAVRVCRSCAEIDGAVSAKALAMVLHAEGAEAIGPDLLELEPLYAAGLRSLGLVWSRPTIFGTGVPFRFPSTPDIGPGLTERGIALVRACNQLGIMVDVSHLNERGFWDVTRISDAPIVATHSNAHRICPVSRNLTDAQLDAVRDSDGVVGLNFATFFLRPDGKRASDTPLSVMIEHLDHLLEKLGEDGVALGSDFDGAAIPKEIGDVAGLPRLVEAMRAAGYGQPLIDKITWGNWLSVLRRTLR